MIDVIDLTKKYGNLTVLDGITETIHEGERVVIIGPSGSGKSTFLRCLNCMEDPTSGSIIFENADLTDFTPLRQTPENLSRDNQPSSL